MIIKHANIIYMPTISPLGGIETYVYELVKKYHNLDIAVVSKNCDLIQKARIERYCKVYIHTYEKIECNVAIINYDQSIIPFINQEAAIYQTIHADYTMDIYRDKPKDNERITGYICITKYLYNKMSEYLPKKKLLLSYNPLTIEKEDKPIIIVSATRLHVHKGKARMQQLASALDRAKINYIWYVITSDIGGITSPNVIFIKNRLDVSKWIDQADYVCLLSDSEACSYTLNEALYRNIPIITTPLPYLEEIGVKDKVNSYIMNFDCSNIDYIVNNIKNIPKFNFNKLNDKYNLLFDNKKSKYKGEIKMKVKATGEFQRLKVNPFELNHVPNEGEEFEISEARYEILRGNNSYKAVFIEEVKPKQEENKEDKENNKEDSREDNREAEIETATKEIKTEKAIKKTSKKKK